MKLILIASYYYPIIDVSSLRIHSYCKALAEDGVVVTVLMVYPPESEFFEDGSFEGVNYVLLGDAKYYYGTFITKLYYRLSGIVKISRHIFLGDIDAVLSYHDNLFTNLCVRAFSIIKKLPFIIDKTEYPYGYFHLSKSRKLLEKFNLSLFDGFIVISTELKDFYSKFSKKVFLLPMTIDPSRYDKIEVSKNKEKQYACLTFGTHNRDGLFDSVKAFHKYLQRSHEKAFQLYLVGDYLTMCEMFPECLNIKKYIIDNNLADVISFLGKLPIDEVPVVLRGASCLITTPLSYSSGGFPTKIGEYMLSGVPLVATAAGEIPKFLTNGYDSFLCEVGDLDEVAEKILYVENNPLKCAIVGRNAILTAKVKFNASTYIDELCNFIKSFKK